MREMVRLSLKRFNLVIMAFLMVSCANGADTVYDIVVYGGTSSGVVAAIQARRMGRSVVLIEPSKRLGGLTSGGLGQTDIGNKAAIGGLARDFYRKVRRYYSDPSAWKWQRHDQYADGGQTRTSTTEDAMWTFEPSVALAIFNTWVKECRIEVVYGERLDLKSGVNVTRSIPWRIVSIRMESGRTFRGTMFIDATYEGDLMAGAKVNYIVGREANARYGETLNGVQTKNAVNHQFVPGVDPYVEKGNPASGLLPFIDPDGPGEEGVGDRRVQAYCYRLCLTDHPDNRIPFHKPEGYNPLWYELLLRNFEAGEKGMPWINSAIPNRKTDTNNRTGFSTDFVGQNYNYPEASYKEREQIAALHRLYQQGLMWTLANNPRVPDHIRNEVARWGKCRDEFTEGRGWQEQLYVREARRMVSDSVMTQYHCQGCDKVDDPIALAAYTMDSHNVQRYVDSRGWARNEGNVEIGGFPPYPISFRSIVPSARECSNLLVPVCLSASHIAYGSIRMEPVFMVLGQSAATAATHAIEENVSIQKIDQARLRKRLLDDGQVLTWKNPHSRTTDRESTQWKIHDMERPAPRRVRPGEPGHVSISAPSDAIILFDGTDLSQWSNIEGGPAGWKVTGNVIEVVPENINIQTRQSFGDCQLHLEWRINLPVTGEGNKRGNSGVMLMGLYEIQIMESDEYQTFADGQNAAVFGQYPPLVNASLPPDCWQSFDIVFHRPRFDEQGKLQCPSRLTLLHNDILVHDDVELKGRSVWIDEIRYEPHADRLPLLLQGHLQPVQFRNIWIRDLERPVLSACRPLPEKEIQVDAAMLEKYAGSYEVNPAMRIEIGRKADHLEMELFRDVKLELFAKTSNVFFAREIDIEIVFQFGSKGEITGLLFQMADQKLNARKIQ